MRRAASANAGRHRRALNQQPRKIKKCVHPVRPPGHKSVKFPECLFRPRIQPALFGKPRRKLDDHKRRRQKKAQPRRHPQTHRSRAVVRLRPHPGGPQKCPDVEKQDLPQAHGAAQVFFGFRLRRIAHSVKSSAGINSSSSRKLRRNGSFEASSSFHVPKNPTRPSCRKITRSASFLARCVSCVTTIDVFCRVFFNFKIRSLMCAAIKGSTIVVGSSYKIACGSSASALAIATDRFVPMLKSEGNRPASSVSFKVFSSSFTFLSTSSSFGLAPRASKGNATFSATVNESNSAPD